MEVGLLDGKDGKEMTTGQDKINNKQWLQLFLMNYSQPNNLINIKS